VTGTFLSPRIIIQRQRCTLIPNTIHSKSSQHHHYFLPHRHSLPLLIQRRETPQKVTGTFIASNIVLQIFLMIILGIPPLTRRQDLRNNLPLPPLLIRLSRHIPRDSLLLRIMIENPRSILRTSIWTLAVRGRGVVHLVEEFEQLAIGHLIRVKCNLKGFGMSSTTRANCAIARTLGITANIPYSRIIQSLPFKLFPIHVFDAPETSRCNCSLLGSFW